MAKFAGATTKVKARKGPINADTSRRTQTYEGAPAVKLDPKGELFTMVTTDFVEDKFYESSDVRMHRLIGCLKGIVAEDPEWVLPLVTWLRNSANMRSISVVLACEYVRLGGPNGRAVVDAACARADEPAEILGYWFSHYGKPAPKAIKKGVGDAAVRLYNQFSMFKYDTLGAAFRFNDVLSMSLWKPRDERQTTLFGYFPERRYGRGQEVPYGLDVVKKTLAFEAIPQDERRERLAEIDGTAFSWERLSGWLPGGMDAQAWEAIIPQMGYMALLRNLRNFEEKGVSKEVLRVVARKLATPDEVARSRQLPFRFWSAYKHSGSTYFASALEDALELSMSNVPDLPGRTLILVDVSMSMQSTVSRRSEVNPAQIAAIFGTAMAKKNNRTDLVMFASNWEAVNTRVSALRTIERMDETSCTGRLGGGTEMWQAAQATFHGHDRIMVFTDGQCTPHGFQFAGKLPAPAFYMWDLNGYGRQPEIDNAKRWYIFGGWSDKMFKTVELLDAGRDAGWPWEHDN